VLLTLHAKLGRWLQLGGHCDDIRDPFFVAWKEAYEESSFFSFAFSSSSAFSRLASDTSMPPYFLRHV